MGWPDVFSYATAVGGIVDVHAASRAGRVTPRAIRDRARREGWWRPFRDVVALPGRTVDGHAWAVAATLHAAGRTGEPSRDLAALTRGSALAVLGVQRHHPTRVAVVIPAGRAIRPHPRLAVIRSRLICPADVRVHAGVPILSGAALLRDLAAVRGLADVRSTAIDLVHAGHLDLGAVRTDLAATPTFPGRSRVRQVVRDLAEAGRTDSPLEWRVRHRLARAGIHLDRGQVPLPSGPGVHLDLGILAIRFGIEVDSFGHHATRQALDRDATRANAVALLGEDWRILHLTWGMVEHRWDRVVAQVREVIAAQSWRHLGVGWPELSDLRR
jgi:very-short-patch-repair endonuclease